MTTRAQQLPPAIWIFALCIPLALLLGVLLSTPTDFMTKSVVGLTFLVLSLPILLRWHHALLICFWNTTMLVFFLPGEPTLGIVMAFASLGISILTRILRHKNTFISMPSVGTPLIFLGVVILATMMVTGGFGGRALGSNLWGAKRYLGVLGAIVGFFALTAQAVPKDKASLLTSFFLIGGATAVVSDLAFAGGPKFFFLFDFFPSELAAQQASSQGTLMRLTGPSAAAFTVYNLMLARYGVRGILDLYRPWRLIVFLTFIALTMIGGYRSMVILAIVIFLVQFWAEGLFRSKIFPISLLIFSLAGAGLVGFVDRLPLSIQRSLSFLPLDVDMVARHDADSTLDWRLQMWKTVIPDVPTYFFLGKGFAYSGTDFYLTQQAVRKGMYTAYEDTLISGNYHNGILTILIPFGIFGFIAFLWFCAASIRVLYQNYRYGDKALENINTFLFVYFVARLIFYLIFYGQFDLDFISFTGTVGLSVALNGGMRSRELTASQGLLPAELQPSPV
jgi:O-antigen ligase